MFEGDRKSTKKGLEMGVTIGVDDAKVEKTHLLVAMCIRLLQKIGLLNLKNWNQLKKETAIQYVPKVCAITGVFF